LTSYFGNSKAAIPDQTKFSDNIENTIMSTEVDAAAQGIMILCICLITLLFRNLYFDVEIPFGPYADVEGDAKVFDYYSSSEVNSDEAECEGFVAKNVCGYLKNNALDRKKYLCVCVPCYNEGLWDFIKTLISLMENFEFMQNTVRKNGFYFLTYMRITVNNRY